MDKIKITLIYNNKQTVELEVENDHRKIKRKINDIFNINNEEDTDVSYYFLNEKNEEIDYYRKKDHQLFLKEKDKKIYVINKNPKKSTVKINLDNNLTVTNLNKNSFLYKIIEKLFSSLDKNLMRIKYKGKMSEYYEQIKIEREKRKMKVFQLINDKKFIYKMKNLKKENEEKNFFDSNSNYYNNNFITNVIKIRIWN